MVHAVGRAASAAKLPSAGLCLNASKAESNLVNTAISRAVGGGRQTYWSSDLGMSHCVENSFGPDNGGRSSPRRPPDATAAAPNRLQTTYVPAEVLYLLEQLPHCDSLRLSLRLGDLSTPRWATPPPEVENDVWCYRSIARGETTRERQIRSGVQTPVSLLGPTR